MKDLSLILTPVEAVQALMRGKEIDYKDKAFVTSKWQCLQTDKVQISTLLNGRYDFRLSSKEMMIIGDVAFPKPETVAPQFNEEYWFIKDLGISAGGNVGNRYWEGDYWEKDFLKKGLVHLSEQNAIAHARALIKLSGGVLDDEEQE